VAAAVAVALALPAGAAAAPTPGAAVVDPVAHSPAQVRAYWTPERMRDAQPVGTDVERPRTARKTTANLLTHIKRRPTRTAGKVFFTAGLYNYQCSGTAVRSASRNLVVTAGHCGYLLLGPGLGNDVQNWEFVPAYDRGRAPFGKWPAKRLAAPLGWTASEPPPVIGPTGEPLGGDSRYDVAAAVVSTHNHHTLQSVVGGRRAVFGQKRNQQYSAIGYPAAPPFDGEREWGCSSGFQGSDSSFDPPQPISIACDMTAGSSGGGWLDNLGHLVSVTSYGYSDQPGVLYGPYFGNAVRAFYRSVSG
jgi:hypothetical protein